MKLGRGGSVEEEGFPKDEKAENHVCSVEALREKI